MVNVKLSDLKSQLEASQEELELAKAHVHRVDGAIQLLKHFIKTEEDEVPEPAPEPDKDN